MTLRRGSLLDLQRAMKKKAGLPLVVIQEQVLWRWGRHCLTKAKAVDSRRPGGKHMDISQCLLYGVWKCRSVP